MTMTDKERLELRTYCASLLKQYGFQFNTTDPVLPVIYIIHREMQQCNETNRMIAQRIDEATSRIRPKVFHFNHEGEAWKFQLAIAMKWILCGGLIMVAISSGIWHWSISSDVDRAQIIINTHDNLSQMAAHAERNRDGSYFIDLSEARGDSVQHFREYVRIDKKTIRIFLGRD
jgi:hypothetical protein